MILCDKNEYKQFGEA